MVRTVKLLANIDTSADLGINAGSGLTVDMSIIRKERRKWIYNLLSLYKISLWTIIIILLPSKLMEIKCGLLAKVIKKTWIMQKYSKTEFVVQKIYTIIR